MDLSGKWNYKEEFDHGVSSGTVIFKHDSTNTLKGEITLLENESGEVPFYVKQTFEGLLLDGNKIILKGKDYKIINGKKNEDFFLDSWEGQINSKGNIVGNTIDLNGVCGVFVMEKMHA